MKRGLPLLLALLVGALSLALTIGLWTHERDSERARLRALFDFNLRQVATRIEARVANYEQMVRGLQGLFDGMGPVDRASFEHYVDAVMAGPDAAGLQGFGFNRLVAPADLAAHAATQRASGLAGFTVHPPGARDEYAPLTFIAPRRPENERAYGFDPLSDPVRREAMAQARDSGNPAITRVLRLRVDGTTQPPGGFVMFLPIYRPGSAPRTVADRRANLVGWVGAVFRIGDLMSTLYGESVPGLVLTLHDGTDVGPSTMMYRSRPATAGGPALQLQSQEYVSFAGHAWTLELGALPEFAQRQGQNAADIILIAGLALSLMLAMLTHQIMTGRARAYSAAQAMTRELRAGEERYRRIVETAGEGIWLSDAAHRLSFVNPRIARWLGYDEAEMTGRPLADFMDDDAVRACVELLETAPAEDSPQLELRLRRRDGSETWVALSLRPILDDSGRRAGGLGMLTDINERRLAEERRSALEAQLRDAQKMEAIGTLAGGIAHDFNNILAAILGNLAVVREDAARGIVNAAGLAQVERSAIRARALVQQILTFSRMQAQELRTQALQPLVEETLSMLRAAMPAQVDLAVSLPSAPVWVRADETQLQQVVMNLCTNAWQALPGGRGRIEVGLEVRPGLPDAGDPHAHLWVEDNGSGMDDATRARVFEPFFTTKDVGHGTGLGLAVVHGIVSVHGGTIQVESRPGLGSRFDLFFPLQAPPPAGSAAAQSDLPRLVPQGQGERVLCLDDDPAMVLMMEGLLQRAGYRVTVFDEPVRALAAASARPSAFDLVVTDHNMPGMNGLEFARALARAWPELPVIVTSGFISDDMRQQAAVLGVGLLQKEFTLERLGGLVQTALAGIRVE